MHPIYNFKIFYVSSILSVNTKYNFSSLQCIFPQLNIYNTFYIWKWIQKQYFL